MKEIKIKVFDLENNIIDECVYVLDDNIIIDGKINEIEFEKWVNFICDLDMKLKQYHKDKVYILERGILNYEYNSI
jgi:hypothetical protein